MRGSVIAIFAVVAIVLVLVGVFVIYSLSQTSPDIIDSDENNDSIPSPPMPGDEECFSFGCNSGEIYVGSVNSDKYYSCDCHYADRILPENIICFTSDADAISKGYIKVENC